VTNIPAKEPVVEASGIGAFPTLASITAASSPRNSSWTSSRSPRS